MSTRKRYIIIFVVVLIFSVAIIASSLPFRFEPTHRIVKQVNCISCHTEEFRDMILGNHIKMMYKTQNRAAYDYAELYGNISQPYKTLAGTCYSCHVAYENFNRFGLTDPFVFNGLSGTVDAQYGNIISWPWPVGNRTVEYFNSANVAISAELEVLSVEPINSTINSDMKVMLSNYSGQQAGSAVCDCGKVLSQGDTQVITVSNMENDYFSVLLLMTGAWSSATINLRLYNTDKGTESFIINVSNSAVYTIPRDISGVSYFKTNGTYKAERLDAIWEMWKSYSVNGNIASSEIIETNTTNGWITANTCSAPDAMCHINQKATYMGMSDGMNPEKSFYLHEMEAVTSKQCKVCHLRYQYGLEIPLNVSPVPPVGGGSGPTPGSMYPAGTYYTVPGGIPSNMQGYLGNTVCASCGHHNPVPSNWIPYTGPTTVPTYVPPPGPVITPDFQFIAWGDTKSGVNILESESKSIVNKNPDFTLYVGDVCDSGPDSGCFPSHENAINGDITGATNNGLFDKTFAVRGNHDSSGSPYWQSVFDFNGVSARIGATNYVEQTLDETYSFDYNNSHFVGIDLPGGDVSTMTSAEISWLDQDLTNAENRGLKHAFLFWHGPLYTVDGHPSTPSSSLVNVLNRHPIISAAFFGHEHVVTYTHLDSRAMSSLTCSFEEVISGGAGAGLYSLSSGRVVDYYLDQSQGSIAYGYTMIGVSGNDFSISFYKEDGTLTKTLSFTETGTC